MGDKSGISLPVVAQYEDAGGARIVRVTKGERQ
jgi:hypothetical protein